MRANTDYLKLSGEDCQSYLVRYGKSGRDKACYVLHYDITYVSGDCGHGYIYKSMGVYFVHKTYHYCKMMYGKSEIYSTHGPVCGLSKRQALKELISFCCSNHK